MAVSQLTPRSRVLLEELEVAKLLKKFPAFMEPEVSLPYSEDPPLDPILSKMIPVHTLTPYFLKILLVLS
jgi:hypothetical protein